VLIGGGFVFAAIMALFTPPRERSARRLLRALCVCLTVYGALAFFGQMLSAIAGPWLPGDSWEWPMGYVGGVVTDSAGRYIAPHCPSGRIQVYDRDRKFVRGWFVDAGGGIFKLRVIEDDKIEVFTARRQRRFLFAPDGTLLERGTYGTEVLWDDLPSGPSSAMVFDTPWVLWPFSHPFIAWALMFIGLVALIALDRKNKARSTAAKQSPGADATDRPARR
jgi:MFS family permease